MNEKNNLPISVIDSGLGGLAFLRAARQNLPRENFIYIGDNAHAPYGDRPNQEITNLVVGVVERYFNNQPVKAIVVACNTATSVAIGTLRERWPDIIWVGMEPQIKSLNPGQTGQSLVLATQRTIANLKSQPSSERAAQLELVAAVGLADLIEQGGSAQEEIRLYLTKIADQYRSAQIETIVLGCTHYILIEDLIKKVFAQQWGREVEILDGVAGTVRQLTHRLEEEKLLNPTTNRGQVTLLTTGDPVVFLPRMKRLLGGKEFE